MSLDNYQEIAKVEEPERVFVRPPQFWYNCAYCTKPFRVRFPFPEDQKAKKYCCWSCQGRNLGIRI